MPMPLRAKYPRIFLFEYPLSAATRPGKRLGLPLPPLLIAPPSINGSNMVESCACPGVSSKATGLPLPSQRMCSLVEYPPLLRPKASVAALSTSVCIAPAAAAAPAAAPAPASTPAEFGPPFLPRQRADEHARRSYPQSVSPTLPPLWCRHLSVPAPISDPRYLSHAICRSEKRLFCRSHSVQAGLPRVRLFSLSTGCR